MTIAHWRTTMPANSAGPRPYDQTKLTHIGMPSPPTSLSGLSCCSTQCLLTTCGRCLNTCLAPSGGLSHAFGWRSCFIALTCFAGALVLPSLALLVPETHQHRVIKALQAKDPAAAGCIKERESILSEEPVFHAPWMPLG
jgi:hypothetical protein